MVRQIVARWWLRRQQAWRAGHTSRHTIRGFAVTLENPFPDIASEAVLSRLEAALSLLEEYQPHGVRHLRRDVRQLWIVRYPVRGAYFPAHRTVMTELTFLHKAADHPDAEVAASILHEAVHARVRAMGLRLGFRFEWSAAEEERVCRRAEVAFGHALPPELGAGVLGRAEPVLTEPEDEAVAPVIDWREARLRQISADISRLDLPAWLRRPVLVLSRWILWATMPAPATARGLTSVAAAKRSKQFG